MPDSAANLTNGMGGPQNPPSLPVIDMSGVEGSKRAEIRRQLADACESCGFFQVINHGVDLLLMKRVKEAAYEFFALPLEEKKRVEMKKGVHYHGYYHPQHSESTGSGSRPTFEHLYNSFYPPLQEFKDRWPPSPEDFGTAFYDYILQSRALAEQLLGLLSESLGLESGALLERLAGAEGTRSNTYTMFYEAKRAEEEKVPMPMHADPGGITVVYSDEVTGLQLLRDGQWLNIEPVRNSFIVNLGDQVQVLTNGRFVSGLHRVVSNSTRRRLSIIHFYNPSGETIIGPMVGSEQLSLYKTYSFKEYMDAFRDTHVVPAGKSNDPVISRFRLPPDYCRSLRTGSDH